MKRLILLLLSANIFSILIYSQSQKVDPDCTIGPFSLTAAGRVPASPALGYNNSNGCVFWTLYYKSTGFTVISIELDSAPDSSGAPGTWVSFNGTAQVGSNPMSSTAGGYVILTSATSGGTPWISINLITATGTGTVTAYTYGYRSDTFFTNGGGGGTTSDVNLKQVNGHTTQEGGTSGSLAIGGQAASGAADAGNPVKVGGSNGTNDYNFKIDSQGNNYNFLGCTNTAEVTLSGTGYTEIVVGTASQVIQICKVLVTSISGGNPTVNTFSVASATISTCAGATELALYGGVTGVADDWGGSLRSAAGKSICVSESTANSDKVTISYAKAIF